MTAVIVNARLELLRNYATMRDLVRKANSQMALPEELQTEEAPLFAGRWNNNRDDIRLAAKEAVSLGQLKYVGEYVAIGPFRIYGEGGLYTITDAGYDWIRAHDALAELRQEGAV